MKSRSFLLCLLLLLLSTAIGATEPVTQVVVLHNGSVIMGTIERTSTRYVVSKGPWHVVRVPKPDVDFIARDMEAAYRKKRSRIPSQDFHAHVRLAQWCLRHDQDRLAGEQLLAIAKLDPYHAAVQALEKQLQRRADVRAGLVPKIRTVSHRTSKTAAPNSATDTTLPPLPNGAVAEFTRVVQPLVLNRCGQTTCHGRAGTSDFRLYKTGGKRQLMTWQNLRSVISQIDAAQITESPILVKATSIHGQAARPPIGPREQQKFRRIAQWVSAVAGDGTTLALANAAQPDSFDDTRVAAKSATPTSSVADDDKVAAPPEPSIDPFDPATFNAQFELEGNSTLSP